MIDYMPQIVKLERVTSRDAYDKKTYTESYITARLDATFSQVRTDAGSVVTQGATGTASTMVTTYVELRVGDRINGREVVRVDPIRWGDGTISHYEAYLV